MDDTTTTSTTTSTTDIIDISNFSEDEYNEYAAKFRYQKNGTKQNKLEGGSSWTVHKRCSSWDKSKCGVRSHQVFSSKDGAQGTELGSIKWSEKQHNHPPPPRLPLDEAVRKSISNQALNGKTTVEIEQAIVNSVDINNINDTKKVANRNQIRNIVTNMRYTAAGLNKEDSVKQAISKFGSGEGGLNFLRKFSVYPTVRILCAAQSGLNFLRIYGTNAMMDGTFEVAELNLTLITILLLINGIAVPAVWLLTDKLTIVNYNWMLKSICKLSPEWKLTVMRSDFEAAIRAAVLLVFPSALVLGDSFHFFYDNRKWARTHGGAEYAADIDESLHLLYCSPTSSEFCANLTSFTEYWTRTWPPYAIYFTRQWVKTISPTDWALFAHPDNTVTGDQKIEGYHSRMEDLGMKKAVKIDFAINNLYREADYYQKIIASPQLLLEHSTQVASRAAKYQQRGSLKKWIPKSKLLRTSFPATASSHLTTNSTMPATTTSTTTTSTTTTSTTSQPVYSTSTTTASTTTTPPPVDLISSTASSFATLAIDPSLNAIDTPIIPLKPTPPPTFAATTQYYGPIRLIEEPDENATLGIGRKNKKRVTCACGQDGNKDCRTQNTCSDCCAKSFVPCNVTAHRDKAYRLALDNPIYQLITERLALGDLSVNILYDGPYSTRQNQWRRVTPKCWVSPLQLEAFCEETKKYKTYYLGRIRDASI